jgi:membrane protease subunit (stomatin/prohibitin family)
MYSKTCTTCGLTLIAKCPDCGKYLNTYVDGKPIKFCNDCGLELIETLEIIEKLEVIENPYVQSDKQHFCPNCGVDIEEPNLRFCSLCGAKIE